MTGVVPEQSTQTVDSADEDSQGSIAPPEHPRYSESMLAVMLGQYAVMQAVVAVTGLVRNKIVALRLGPSAFGEIAQLSAVVASVTAITSVGMQVSLSRNVARATTREERQAYLANANGLVLSLSLLATLGVFVLLLAGDLLSVVGLTAAPEVVVAACLFFLAIPLLGIQTNYLAFLQGILDVKGLAIQRSVAVIVATAICVPLVWFFGLVGAAANFLVLNALLAVLLGLRCRSLGYGWLAVRLDRKVIGVLAAFGLASMAAGFAQTFADAAIRASLLKQFGTEANGLLQAPLVLAATLQGVVLGSVGSMSLVTVSGASDATETKRTVDSLLNVVLPISAVALGLLGLLGVPAIVILYSEEFASSASLLPWILCADLVLTFVWVVGAPLLASGDRAIWLILELVWAGSRWAFSIALLPAFGVAAVGMGMLFAVVLHLVLVLIAIRYRYGLRIGRRHLASLVAGMALIALLAVTGAGWTASIPVMAGATLIWFGYAVYVARSTPVAARLRALVLRG